MPVFCFLFLKTPRDVTLISMLTRQMLLSADTNVVNGAIVFVYGVHGKNSKRMSTMAVTARTCPSGLWQPCPHGKSPGVSSGPGRDPYTCVEWSGGRGFSLQCTDGLTGSGQYNNLQNKLEKRHQAVSWAVEYIRYGDRDSSSTGPRPTSSNQECQIHMPTWSRSHDVCPTLCLHVLTYILSSCPFVKHAYPVHLAVRVMPILS